MGGIEIMNKNYNVNQLHNIHISMKTNKSNINQIIEGLNACKKGDTTFYFEGLSKNEMNDLLIRFCETDNLAIIKYAICNGADPLNANFYCLTVAAMNEKKSIVDYLVSNYDYVKNAGEASFEILRKSNFEILDLLVNTALDEENLIKKIKSRSSLNEEPTLIQDLNSYITKKNILHELSQSGELDQNDKSSDSKKI